MNFRPRGATFARNEPPAGVKEHFSGKQNALFERRRVPFVEPELPKLREECREWATCDEDVLSYALFPQVAEKFFKYRQAKQNGIDSTVLDGSTHPV